MSAVGSMFVFVTFIAFKRKYPARLTIYFSLCTCMLAIAFLLGHVSQHLSGGWCVLQGAMNQFWNTAAIFWWLSITVSLYYAFVVRREVPVHLEMCMHVLSWGLPLAMTVVPVSMQAMTLLGPWCWISGKRKGLLQFVFYYGPLGLACAIGVVLWLVIASHLVQRARRHKGSRLVSHAYPMHAVRYLSFTILFFLIFLFTLVHRVYVASSSSPNAPFLLYIMQVVCSSSQGIFTFLAFGARPHHVHMWIALVKYKVARIPWCRRCVPEGWQYEEVEGEMLSVETPASPESRLFKDRDRMYS
eukprot:TRINITY_DN6456_c0_g1_i1.p1 TRINITY_DN6456_c0_g1~~TRINITY_DN6456_c0_g1_i1.p1  ORF type:complete len:352 (-),score=62.56 TRINITY_DN6456_c0_g1_i1:34-936(-)